MPTFDPVERKLCIRVIYDGAASAGKTTNVRQLTNLVVAQHCTSVTSPAELRGRTLYFDWARISAGSICGFPLVCEIISVPGQEAFASRRRELLGLADVIVFVADGSTAALDETRRSMVATLAAVRAHGELRPGLVVQANKQDQADALSGPALLAALGHDGVEIVEAIATDGIGVVDTFVTAVRSVARVMRSRAEEGELRVSVRAIENEQHLLARLVSVDIDAYAAAEFLLEQASAECAEARSPAPSVGVASDVLRRALDAQPTAATALRLADVREAPLPNVDVPTGFVWPAHTGRRTLQDLGLRGHVSVDGEGVSIIHEAYRLSTSRDLHFVDAEAAREALVRSARERTQLGALLVEHTVLVVQPTESGDAWLWMVTPEAEPLDAWLMRERARATGTLAVAIAEAVAVTIEHGLALCPRLDAFRVQGELVRYAGPLTKIESTAESRASSALAFLLGALAEVGATDLPIEQLISAVARTLQTRIGSRAFAAVIDAAQNVGVDGPQAGIVALLRPFGAAA